MATADEVIASVDATLDGWRSAFEPVPAKTDGDGEPSTPAPTPTNDAKKSPTLWKDPEAYQRRLGTFSPDTFFAKPLELSPLVCAAFGWENTSKDIIKCCHPNCGATICVLFHPDLNADSHRDLCRKYQGMLASSHNAGCPFRSFARRWAKAMRQCSSKSIDGETTNRADTSTKENDPEHLMEQVSEGLSDTNPSNFYVPPYFLGLSDDFLQLEDCSGDGSITRDRVKEGALQLRAVLQARIGEGAAADISLPDAVAAFCRELRPGADVDGFFHLKDSAMKVPYLLSAFGWSLCDELAEEAGAVVKCSICQVRARVDASQPSGETASRKRRRIETGGDASSIKLIDSHRVYCPFVSGFRRGDTPGWKIVASNLLKAAAN